MTTEQSVLSYSLRVSLLTSILEVFATEILVPLSRPKLLDPSFKPLLPSKLLSVPIAYVRRRDLNERHDGASLLLRIRDVAIQLCKGSSDGRSERDYFKQLCPLVAEMCRSYNPKLKQRPALKASANKHNMSNKRLDPLITDSGSIGLM
jgi:hypothetical protein